MNIWTGLYLSNCYTLTAGIVTTLLDGNLRNDGSAAGVCHRIFSAVKSITVLEVTKPHVQLVMVFFSQLYRASWHYQSLLFTN